MSGHFEGPGANRYAAGARAEAAVLLRRVGRPRAAAAGRSSRQIAADLHLSVRTVESRLQRVYEKLGVCGRRELFGALEDLPAA